jgi:hypothetical protein
VIGIVAVVLVAAALWWDMHPRTGVFESGPECIPASVQDC